MKFIKQSKESNIAFAGALIAILLSLFHCKLIAVCLSRSVILESDPQQVVHRVALRVTFSSSNVF